MATRGGSGNHGNQIHHLEKDGRNQNTQGLLDVRVASRLTRRLFIIYTNVAVLDKGFSAFQERFDWNLASHTQQFNIG